MSGIFSAGGAGNVGVSGFYPVTINDSLRFEDGSSAYLNRTPSSAGNRQTWTWSGWVKRGNLGINTRILGTSYTSASEFYIRFKSNDTLEYGSYEGGGTSNNFQVITTQVFRDVSAWYHIVFRWDTTQSTAANRLRIYVNGEQITAFSTANYPSQNYNGIWNNTVHEHRIGYGISGDPFDGYMAELNLIDGTSLEPDSFGEAKDGVWIPKSYSGSYGTNGFHLEFNGNTNDTSGNGNNWTANNISAHDYVPDSPTNNFAVMNALEPSVGTSVTLSEGNLKTVGSTSSYSGGVTSSFEQTSGKWYWEVYVNSELSAGSNHYSFIGAATGENNLVHKSNNSQVPSVASGVNGWSWEGDGTINLTGTGTKAVSSVTAPSAGDVLGFAIDLDNGNVYFYHNGTAQNSGSPVITGVSDLLHNPMVGVYNGSTVTFNFGQDSTFAGGTTAGGNADGNGRGDFKHSVPSSHLALCSANLPEPTIIDGSEHFNTVTYTGPIPAAAPAGTTGAVTGVGFQPDWVWIKTRSTANNHQAFDSVRGVATDGTKGLIPNTTAPEKTTNLNGGLYSLDSDGFTVVAGTDTGGRSNETGSDDRTYAAWNWKAGTSFSNSAGTNGATIASSGSVNTDAGFSIVSYVGTATSNSTIYHGLGAVPKLIIHKNRDVTDQWSVYNSTVGTGKKLALDTAGTPESTTNHPTVPTTSVFYVGAGQEVNGNTNDMIAYCFADVDGYSKVGSYIGGGSNFPFVFTGFRPAWIMIKETTNLASWYIQDSTRDVDNPVQALYPIANDALAENSSWGNIMDLLSNGFKPRVNDTAWNRSGGTYIYLAFAESPFKYANAR